MSNFPFDRRELLKTGSIAISGVTMLTQSANAETTSGGEQIWAFQTDDSVFSSPTVVDGTVFVGSNDGNVYALDAGVDGSSEGSRVNLGTLGHHHVWAPQGSKDANRSDSENGGETESEGSKDANRSDSENGGETESSADGGTSIAALSAGGGAAAGLLYLARDIIDNDDIDDTTDDH